jgi:hypothetical protein
LIPSPLSEDACTSCGRRARHKTTIYGSPKPSECASCGVQVTGDRRPTVLGPLDGDGPVADLVVCAECAHRCRKCAPLHGTTTRAAHAPQAHASIGAVPNGRVQGRTLSLDNGASRCVVCDGQMQPQRSTLRYCSARCSKRAYRDRRERDGSTFAVSPPRVSRITLASLLANSSGSCC